MLPKKFFDVLNHEGVVTVISWGDTEEPHFANTWNSYLVITEDERILIPAYGFRVTERNVNRVGKIKMSLGSKGTKTIRERDSILKARPASYRKDLTMTA